MILSGLEAGQNVVVSGQFLIDSEASLLGAYQRMGAGTGMAEGMEGMSDMKGSMGDSMQPAMQDMKGMSDMEGMSEEAHKEMHPGEPAGERPMAEHAP